ncbi:MAG: hypothetical protein ACI8RZ_000317 [Myxococcota bacterium]|jgi:hypothetical protein
MQRPALLVAALLSGGLAHASEPVVVHWRDVVVEVVLPNYSLNIQVEKTGTRHRAGYCPAQLVPGS